MKSKIKNKKIILLILLILLILFITILLISINKKENTLKNIR